MPCKGVREDWSCKFSAEELLKRTDDLINTTRSIYDSVAAVPDTDVNYDTVLKVLADAECECSTKRYILDQVQYFSPDQKIRDASTEADQKLRAFDVEISMRQDIFKKLIILEKQKDTLKPEPKRYLEKLIKNGKRNGLHLPGETQEMIKTLKNKINSLCIQFMKNLSDEATTLEFSDKDLIGLPDDYFGNLKKLENGNYEVTLKYPDVFPIMEKCRNPETRRRMFIAFNSRCVKENDPILHEVTELRHKLANILGYPRHTEYATELLMVKSGDNVQKFLTELWHKLEPLWEDERKLMLELKEKECNELGIPFDGKLQPYDLKFYATKVEKIKYSVDHTKLKEYFPLQTVTEGLCKIYQDLLGLKFTEIENPEVWHEDVQMFKVEDKDTGDLMGYFFLDLFPRTGKYTHACVIVNQPGCLIAEGVRQVTVGTMLTNFTKPQKDKPSLLNHSEVVTYFHEFGHLMHAICAQADLAEFAGIAVESDFVEAPSQMLENWCWEVEPLKMMSCHYATKSEIPEDLLNALIKSNLANAGYRNLRQVVLATFDFKIHSKIEKDINRVFRDTCKEIMGIEESEDTFMGCSFQHLCGEYDARYYSYLWSEVYCMDMFYTRFKDGKVLDPETGKDYRNKILKPGGSKDAIDMLVDFLGRHPTQDAFLKSKGLKV
ncbi:thimet oligopeptidase-like [Argiope bruennichi]|uniref:Thimet oligopeptidase like protein n=1 Tax=Argiope bruennichi TaxID=94029 RepID=A0A8T0EQN6_ARGBR|nr:thimet oligopeptidase-like [Argiope bruennichi]KAF8778100.1 Thimet oligopeptidase like protein [Argiope bruennichi]